MKIVHLLVLTTVAVIDTIWRLQGNQSVVAGGIVTLLIHEGDKGQW